MPASGQNWATTWTVMSAFPGTLAEQPGWSDAIWERHSMCCFTSFCWLTPGSWLCSGPGASSISPTWMVGMLRPCCFSPAGNWIRNGVAGTWTSAHLEWQDCGWLLYLLGYNTAPLRKYFLFLMTCYRGNCLSISLENTARNPLYFLHSLVFISMPLKQLPKETVPIVGFCPSHDLLLFCLLFSFCNSDIQIN